MAAPLRGYGVVNFLQKLQSFTALPWQPQSVRTAIKRNKIGRTPGKHRSPKVAFGQRVEKGWVIATQLRIRNYPGENVGLDRRNALRALEAGRVMLSAEVLNPYPQSPLYPAVKAGRVIRKKFWHVVPDPQIGRFKLVSEI